VFVQDNSVRSIKFYMREKLSTNFSPQAIKELVRRTILSRLDVNPSDYLLLNDVRLSESDLLFFREIVQRLLNNEPPQYIFGNTNFYGLNIKCDSRALIPRPETEELVNWIRESHLDTNGLRILDICTGSGCIALALKSAFQESDILGIDISSDALALAKENASQLNLKVEFEEFNVLKNSFLSCAGFNCWVANPPYVLTSEKADMEPNVLLYEPDLALFVNDDDPLIFYRIIAHQATNYLSKNGNLFFEIHESKGHEMVNLLDYFGFVNIELRKDLQGKNRMIKCQKA